MIGQRKILVIGATGQQGGAVARLLLQKRHEVYALTHNTESETPKEQHLRNLGAKLIKGDLENPDSLEQATNGVDSVFLMEISTAKSSQTRGVQDNSGNSE